MVRSPEDTRSSALEAVDVSWIEAVDAVVDFGQTQSADAYDWAIAALASHDSAVDAFAAAVLAYWSEQPEEAVAAARQIVHDDIPMREHFLSAIRRDGTHPDGDDYEIRLCRSRSGVLANLLDSLVAHGDDEKALAGFLAILRKVAAVGYE